MALTESRSLYEQDILLWVEDTVAKLRAGDFQGLDLDHVIEEIEAVGRSERREFLSRMTRLLEHLLKRLYVPLPDNYRGWEQTIRHQRSELRILLKSTPSLKALWEGTLEEGWSIALDNVSGEYGGIRFPDRWPFGGSVEVLLGWDLWLEAGGCPSDCPIESEEV